MTLEEIELAVNRHETIHALSPLDELCYFAFDGLYTQYRSKTIDRTQASERKRKIVQKCNMLKYELSAAHALSVKYADGIRQTDEAVSALCKQSADFAVTDVELLIQACRIIDTLLGGNVTVPTITRNRSKRQ